MTPFLAYVSDMSGYIIKQMVYTGRYHSILPITCHRRGGAGHGKSALVQHVLGAVRADDGARTTVLVAQSSATLGGVTLFTVRVTGS